MKEYTVIYTVEITDIIPPEMDITEEQIMSVTPEIIASNIKRELGSDNVVVSDLKVFITGDSK